MTEQTCRNGHSLDDPDIGLTDYRGRRTCRVCKRIYDQERRARLDESVRVKDARWSDAEIGMVLNPPSGRTLVEVAQILGRSIGSVNTMRVRLRRGWSPTSEPLSADEIDFIRNTPELTALQVAEQLGRLYKTVTRQRAKLIRDEGASDGHGHLGSVLGRTYGAVSMRAQKAGLNKREDRKEPSGLWAIWFPEAKEAA